MQIELPGGHWLSPEQQWAVCEKLVEYGLLKWDNDRNLPLKSGGVTDVYVNLRNARNEPHALQDLARWFQLPLTWLQVNRFAEVPHAVSCFAGPLAVNAGIPMVTVREQAKEGRATDSLIIGNAESGETIPIVDDVITDGASKITPYQALVARGVHVPGIIVLVDREQGWQRVFAERDIPLRVWSGMTLHTVRQHLIGTGLMRRCDPKQEEKNPLIIALDGMEWEKMLSFLEQIRTLGCIIKVNDALIEAGTDTLLPKLATYGRVMVDLKHHDIPQTVSNACRRLRRHKPWGVTVHCSGGEEMLRAACEALRDTTTKVLGVTVLTSIDKKTCEKVYRRSPIEEVHALAQIARNAGADGLVCSPEEVDEIRTCCPALTLVTPGVRSDSVDANDQKRINTPRAARNLGANYLVMGRQITEAADPVHEVRRVLTEELQVVLS